MINKPDKNTLRKARHRRMRNKLSGTTERPRLDVYRSLNHIYVQVIDDEKKITLASASTMDSEVQKQIKDMTKKEAAKVVGTIVAKRAIDKGVKQVIFDRGGYLYTGRVANVADGAREAGLDF